LAEPTIRAERPGDAAAIARLLEGAFGGRDEARLVAAFRAADDLSLSLVAEDAGAIVGCIHFSPLAVDNGPQAKLHALAPLAVASTHRRQGLGARLVEEGLALLSAKGAAGVVVLGDPAYYGRFGFRAEAAAGLRCAWSGPYLQALMFAGDPPVGELRYAPAFAAL
jgi:putative acetyltransferase